MAKFLIVYSFKIKIWNEADRPPCLLVRGMKPPASYALPCASARRKNDAEDRHT